MQLIWLQICLNSFQLYISQLGNVALDTNCIIGLSHTDLRYSVPDLTAC